MARSTTPSKPRGGLYLPRMGAYVRIAVTAAVMILSPAYDLGLTEDELRKTNLEKLNTY